ncbi:MAG TPA: hypothetical protein VN923_17180 [Thermoanaerobaculia bacterium]|nr:hypothetical protein [Thermoanaerobaculia bacterium]
MRLSFLMFLLVLALQVGTSRQETAAHKLAVEPSAAESDPCDSAVPGTALCARIRIPVG